MTHNTRIRCGKGRKPVNGTYAPDATTGVKTKNRAYTQAEGGAEFFERHV
jgi:hypothetical protein